MKRHSLPLIMAALLAASVSAQQAQESANRTNPGPVTQVSIQGKPIAGDDLLIRKGTTYVSVAALAQALGTSVASEGSVAVISFPASANDCGIAPGETGLSQAYRKAAVRIPDEIETLRVLVYKHAGDILAARFDAIDRDISEADFRAATNADKSVSYALSHANATLAISYYRLWRGVPPDQAKLNQLDSVLCSMESKFALQVGRLSGRESCSVFHLNQTEAKAKPPLDK